MGTQRRRMVTRAAKGALLGALAVAAPGMGCEPAPHAGTVEKAAAGPGGGEGRLTFATLNTTRLSGRSPYEAAAAVAQTTYAATHREDRPHAVTLVRADRQADAMLAASRITHFPVNAPVLFVDEDRIPPATRAELLRLGPDGNAYDVDVQVYLVGPISERVEREIREELGYRTRAFRISDPFELSEELDRWVGAVHGRLPDEVAIVQYEELATGLPAVAWNAHMGHGMLFVRGGEIPPATRRALENRRAGQTFLYLFGGPEIIPEGIERELAAHGHVQRVPGRDAYEIGVAFAGYRDAGLEQGSWIGWTMRDFGWDIGEAGHGFTFATPDAWHEAVAGSLLSHMGKHGPLLLTAPDTVPPVVATYLERLRPSRGAPGATTSNHGWILGGTRAISWEAQVEIDALLEAWTAAPGG